MSRWGQLRAEIEARREQQPKYDLGLVTATVGRLRDAGRCDERSAHWLNEARGPERSKILTWGESADARDNRGHAALRLRDVASLGGSGTIEHLRGGPVLSLRVIVDRAARVRTFSVGVEGVHATEGRWYARVELTEMPEGQGHCAHPLLHAHVGDDPDAALSPRVPVPWMLPHEALEWLLATIDPSLEPAP